MQILEKLVETLGKIIRKDLPDDPETLEALSLTEDIGLDSLDFISFLFRVEETFDLKIPEEDIDEKNLVVLGTLAAYIKQKTGG